MGAIGLFNRVPAVASALVDVGRTQQPYVVVVAESRDRQTGQQPERPYAEELVGHGRSMEVSGRQRVKALCQLTVSRQCNDYSMNSRRPTG
jgi:hypothetical protein